MKPQHQSLHVATCALCQAYILVNGTAELRHIKITHAKAIARKARNEAYRSCGLIKVRGALGGTYWE